MEKNRFISKRVMGLMMSLSVAITTIAAPATAFAATKDEYTSVKDYLSSEYMKTASETDWGESNQQNYQMADGSSASDYLIEGFEWSDIRKGTGTITVAGANTEDSIALYVFTTCFHGTSTLSRKEVVVKDIQSLAKSYDRVDVIAIDGPDEWGELSPNHPGLYGGLHEVKSFTSKNVSTAESWANDNILFWSGAHFTGNVPAAIRKYMFGDFDAEINEDNLVNIPSAIYVSADLLYQKEVGIEEYEKQESLLSSYDTPELFHYLAEHYCGDTQRYFSSSQSGYADNEPYMIIKLFSKYDSEYMKIVAGVFNPELYDIGAKAVSSWSGASESTDVLLLLTDKKFASDYNYKDDILSAGIRLPDKQISVQKTVSDDFKIMGVKAVTQSGIKANVSVNGQTITATAASFMSGDEISMEITVQLKNGLSKQFTSVQDCGDGAKLLDGDISIMSTESTKFMPLTRDVTLNLTWEDDENRDGIRPDSIDVALSSSEGSTLDFEMSGDDTVKVTGLLAYINGKAVTYTATEDSLTGYSEKLTKNTANSVLTLTNTHTSETTSISVTKVWEDDNNRDGIRPDIIYVKLSGSDGNSYDAELTGKGGWKYEFKDLYCYSDGTAIKYEISEVSVDGYTSMISAADGGYIITNTHDLTKQDITVTYEWEDDDNRDGIRPDTVSVVLSGDDGSSYEAELTKDDGYAYDFNNLLVYKNGSKIKYSLKVSAVSGYSQTISAVDDGFRIKGVHGISTTSIKVQNKWSDDNNRDGLRPDSVDIILTGSNGKNYTQTVSASNDGEVSFDNLPVYTAGGEKITYEVLLPEVDGYKSSFSKATKSYDYVILNSHTPETTSIKVTKVWDDGNDADGMRKNATFILTGSDGSKYEGIIKKDAKTPTYTFANLYVYANGEKITYTLDEKDTEGYESKFERTTDGYTVTNTHVPGDNTKDDDEDTISIDTPKTGDDNNLALWLTIAGILACGGGGAGFYLFRKKVSK